MALVCLFQFKIIQLNNFLIIFKKMLVQDSEIDIPDARSSGCLVNIDKGLFLLFGRF